MGTKILENLILELGSLGNYEIKIYIDTTWDGHERFNSRDEALPRDLVLVSYSRLS